MHKTPLNIALLLCDDVDEAYKEKHGDFLKMFQNAIDPSKTVINITPISCYLGTPPPHPTEYEGYLISGSKYSVYEPLPWIEELSAFIRDCYQQKIKCVGLCFGHQLIARALGGVTEKAKSWGLGIHQYNITEPQPWMDPISKNEKHSAKYQLIAMHQDQVTKIPTNGKTIGGSDFCPNGMILIDNIMLGIQGHPEFNKSYCKARSKVRRHEVGEEAFQCALLSLDQHESESDKVTRWIRRFFLQDVESEASLEPSKT